MHYTLHMTARCNLRCDYCYVQNDKNIDALNALDMTRETAFATVDLAGDNPETKRAGLIFFGGEPLLLKDLIYDTIAYARNKEKSGGCRYFFKITTNGLLLDDDFIEYSKKENIFIAMSVDGTQTAHDMHRADCQGNGSYDKVVVAAKKLLAAKPYSPVLMTIRPDTLSMYADGVESLFDLGFKYVVPSLDYSSEWEEEHLPELERQYERLAELYISKTLKEDKFYFSPFDVKISSHINNKTYCRERCELGLRQLSVGVDGTLYPCVQFVGDSEFALGDVFTGINEAKRQSLYTRNETEKEGCAQCVIRARCNHYCACLNRQATGSIDEISPMLCAHERIVLPIADRVAETLYKTSALFVQKQYNDFYTLASLVEDNKFEEN